MNFDPPKSQRVKLHLEDKPHCPEAGWMPDMSFLANGSKGDKGDLRPPGGCIVRPGRLHVSYSQIGPSHFIMSRQVETHL